MEVGGGGRDGCGGGRVEVYGCWEGGVPLVRGRRSMGGVTRPRSSVWESLRSSHCVAVEPWYQTMMRQFMMSL